MNAVHCSTNLELQSHSDNTLPHIFLFLRASFDSSILFSCGSAHLFCNRFQLVDIVSRDVSPHAISGVQYRKLPVVSKSLHSESS
jgi:hypothetical protein